MSVSIFKNFRVTSTLGQHTDPVQTESMPPLCLLELVGGRVSLGISILSPSILAQLLGSS